MKTIKKKHKKYHKKRKLTRAKKGGRPTLNDVKKLKKLFDTNITKFNEQIRNTGHIPLINILQMIYNNVELSNIQNIIVNQLYNLYNSNKNFFNQQLLLLDYSSLAYLLQSIPDTAIYSDFRQNVNDILIFRSRNPTVANIAQNLSDSQAFWSHSDSMFGPIADVVLDDEMAEVSQLSAQAKPFSPASRLSASAQPFNPASRLSASAQSFTPSVAQPSRPPDEEIQWPPDEDYVIELGVNSLTSKPPPVAQPSRPPAEEIQWPPDEDYVIELGVNSLTSKPPPVAQPSRPQPSRPPVAQPSRPPPVAQPSKSSKHKYVVESDSEIDSDTEGKDEINITLSKHAKERMDERSITLDDITYLIKRAKRYRKASNDHGNVRIYTGEIPGESDLYKIITSDSADLFVITVIRDKDLYSQKVLKDMEDNDISTELVEYIIWNTKKYVAEKRDEQGERLEFSYTTDGQNITVFTNKGRTKIIGIRVESMYSPVSQHYKTHMIDYKTEGCALQSTHVSEDKGVDCGRCAISYAKLGDYEARTDLQEMCVKDKGAGNFEINKWLAKHAVQTKHIDKLPPKYHRPPRIYFIHPEFVKSIKHIVGKNNKFGVAAEIISDKLLGYNEQVISFWDCHKTYGHYFNIGKLDSDTIWYINPQGGLNPGNITLLDQINQTCGEGSWVTQIAFILQPWQADLLFDNNGKPLLISAVEYDKKGYHHTGGTRKRKTRKRKAKNSRTRKCKAKKCKTRKYKAKKYKTRKYK